MVEKESKVGWCRATISVKWELVTFPLRRKSQQQPRAATEVAREALPFRWRLGLAAAL